MQYFLYLLFIEDIEKKEHEYSTCCIQIVRIYYMQHIAMLDIKCNIFDALYSSDTLTWQEHEQFKTILKARKMKISDSSAKLNKNRPNSVRI